MTEAADRAREGAPQANRQGPRIGIRARLIAGFLIFFVLGLAITVGAWLMLSRLELRLRFLETTDRYMMEIQQARRFEKNYFLYGSNLSDVRDHLERAGRLLDAAAPEAARLLSPGELTSLRRHHDRYGAWITRLESLGNVPADERSGIEAALRRHGSEMVDFSLELAERERANVDQTLALFKRFPFAFLLFLLAISVILANFLSRQMVSPLTRLMQVTGRIATGDFTPIAPARWYRDEFSSLRDAINTMMRELARRQEVLVQAHKLSAVGTLTAGVAHELNNPINNIVLTAEVLREDYAGLSDEERLEMVEDLAHEAARARQIVRNLLDFARQEEMTSEHVDLAELLRRTASLASNQVKLSGARIELAIPSNLPGVHGDAQSLGQVFLNLVLNALDAVGKGGKVRIAAEAAHEFQRVHVTVSDDGRGIPPDVLPFIFDPFFTTKPRGKGTGLGLSVSLGIVRQHGGDIRVESAAGGGSTFTVILPAVMVPTTGTAES